MKSFTPHHCFTRTPEGERALLNDPSVNSDERWLLAAVRVRRSWGDLQNATRTPSAQERLSHALSRSLRKGWVRLIEAPLPAVSDSPFYVEPSSPAEPTLASELVEDGDVLPYDRDATGSSALQDLMSRHGAVPAAPTVYEPVAPVLVERDDEVPVQPVVSSPRAPAEALPPPVVRPPVKARSVDESAVAVLPVGGDDLLKAMGILGERPAPAVAPVVAPWSGKGGLDVLLAALEAPVLPAPSDIPEYGYGGQASVKPASEDSFQRMKDAPGGMGVAHVPVRSDGTIGETQPSQASEGEPPRPLPLNNPALQRQMEKLRRENAERQAAQDRVKAFHQETKKVTDRENQRADVERKLEEVVRETESTMGLSARLRALRAQQTAASKEK